MRFDDEAAFAAALDAALLTAELRDEWAARLTELIVGATDSRFFREKGTVAYGTGLFSPGVSFSQFASRFHGHDERIDVESLGLCTDLWLGVVEDLLG